MFFTNQQQCFQHTQAIETGIYDFPKWVLVAVIKNYIKSKTQNQFNSKITNNFHEQSFNFELNKEFNKFFLKVLDKHAPPKKKIKAKNSNQIEKDIQKYYYAQDLNFATHF